MKKQTLIRGVPPSLVVAALLSMSLASPAWAQTPLQGRVVLRPVTPGDVATYKLPAGTEVSGGLATVGVGMPVYLEVEFNSALPTSNLVTVTWALTNTPPGSTASLQPSPLGANVPVYEPADRLIARVADRRLLRPDVAGRYTVVATLTATGSGTTNVSRTLTIGNYMGLNTCALCHSGGAGAPSMVPSWQNTAHASIFTQGINGATGHYAQSCLQCHTVGYDTNTNAVNGGFDDVAKLDQWTFPTVLTNSNWAAVPANLKNVANIQCENCHGPGSQHAYALGDTNLITATTSSGACNQCHDAPTHHVKNAEWNNSLHAITTRDPAGNAGCVGCHTAPGFIGRMDGDTTINTTYNAITCQACHEPHGQTIPDGNPHLVRAMAPVTFMDGTTVTNAGMGTLCMNCHHARQNAATYAATAAASPYFGPHHGPQGDMIEGVNGFTYGQTIPSSAHRTAVSDVCVTCHMQTVNTTDPAFTHAGGHTFEISWAGNSTNAGVDLVAACQNCHGPQLTSFDFPLQDYDGDGVIDGVQTEVQHLMDKLSTLLPPVGQAKASLSINSTWTRPQLEAAYNWLFVNNDGSHGIHNTAYAVGLLKASIANLTGDANNDGLPDAWQIQYFGSIASPNAAPNATPAGDGIPNWLKYTLGLNPTVPGITVPGGVVWADGNTLGSAPVSAGDTNAVQIFTAAEVAFNTQVGVSYQIQAIDSLGGQWQNIGSAIPGTGQAVSYVTPTRSTAHQFYRVVHTP